MKKRKDQLAAERRAQQRRNEADEKGLLMPPAQRPKCTCMFAGSWCQVKGHGGQR